MLLMLQCLKDWIKRKSEIWLRYQLAKEDDGQGLIVDVLKC